MIEQTGHPIPAGPPTPASDEAVAKAARRRRRLRRRIARGIVLAVLAVVVGAWFLVTRSPLTGAMVLPKLEEAIGLKVDAEAVAVGVDGTVVLKRARFMAPGVAGPAGQVFDVARIEADIGWSSLVSGSPSVRNLTLVEPVLRVSQSRDDQSVNIAKIKVPKTDGGTGAEIPTITIERGTIELGEHTGGAYTPLKRIGINGRLRPTLEAGAYVIDLRQMGDNSGFDLRGVLSQKEIALTLRGLTLDDWTPETVPTPVRGIFSLLDMKGEIAETSFDYVFGAGMQASIALKNVALNLPVSEGGEVADVAGSAAKPPALMRMQDVNGVITFDGTGVRAVGAGKLEDLPYQLNLAYTGLSVDSAFTCELISNDFELSANPQIVRFAPPLVRERLENFSNPTGIVNTVVRFERGAPVGGKPGEVRVEGRLNFRETTAAFHKFPYRFHNLSGSVRFDDQRIDILEVKGDAPGGAKIRAKGEIYPPSSEAYANIEVHVDDVPIDETLKEAMGPGRRRILDVIFNQERYAALLAEGLIREPGSAKTAAPEFAIGGRATIDVKVIREPGPGSHWHEEIDVRLPHAGLVPEPFPLPILADDVTITVRDDTARVVGGTYRGLRGGTATLEATTDLSQLKVPDAEVVPKVRITARDVPVDDLLVRATPGAKGIGDRQAEAGGAEEGSRGLSAREVLRQLHVDGTVNCEARIDERGAGSGVLGYDIEVEVPGVTTRARSSSETAAPFVMEGTSGTIRVSESRLEVNLMARAPGAVEGAEQGAPAGAAVAGTARIPMGESEEAGEAIDINVRCNGLDLTSPIEEIVGVFSKETAAQVQRLRGEHKPDGRVDVSVDVSRPVAVGTGVPKEPKEPGPLVVRVDVTGGRELSLNAAGGRVGLARADGLARVIADGRTRAVFEGFGGPMTMNGAPCGRVSVSGGVDLAAGDGVRGGVLDVAVRDAMFESPVSAWAAQEKVGGGLGEFYGTARPRGLFDADLRVSPSRGGGGEGGGAEAWGVEGSISPRSVVFDRNGQAIAFSEMAGRVEFAAGSGKLIGLSGKGTGWSWGADGSWVVEEAGRAALKTTLSVESQGLGPELKAVLPEALLSALAEVQFDLEGRLRVPGMMLKWTPGREASGAGDSVSAHGRMEVERASLEAGLPVAEATGAVDFGVEREPGRPAKFELAALMERFRLAGVEMTGGRAKVVGGESEGEVLVPLVSADCHHGRMTGQARVRQAGEVRRYEGEFALAGVQFGPVLRDLAEYSKQNAPEAPVAAEQVGSSGATATLAKADDEESPDTRRGALDAQISLAGIVGDEASRRGRGEARVYGGRVVNYPLVMRLIRVSNLQLPVNDTVELARASYYVEGGTVTFEDMSVSSGSVEILGYGTVTWPGLEADMEFNSRSVRRLPVLSDVLETVRDELISTRVTGKVSDPEVRTVGFAGTRKFLSRLFGGETTEQERKLAEIEERARRERERARSAGAEPARRGE